MNLTIFVRFSLKKLLGYNNHVKRDVTHRERAPIAQFTAKVFEMANELSIEYKEEKRIIQSEPRISNQLWKKSAVWAKDTNIATIKINEDELEYVCYAPSSKWLESGKSFDLASVEKLKAMDWKSLNQYTQFGHFMFYEVVVAKDKEKWRVLSKCDCPDFFKNYVCKHSIGIALRRKIAVLPKTAIPTALSQNKKSGRPAKSVKALLVQ